MKRNIDAIKKNSNKPKRQKTDIEASLDPIAAIKKAVIAGNVEDLKKLLAHNDLGNQAIPGRPDGMTFFFVML